MDKELIYRVRDLLQDITLVSYYNDSGFCWICPSCGKELINVREINSFKHLDDCELMLVLEKLEKIIYKLEGISDE